MSDLYDEEEFKQAVRIAWQAHAHWPRRKPPQMDDLRNMVAFALERMAPKIAARALREAADASDRRVLGAPFSAASLGPWLRARAERIEGKG